MGENVFVVSKEHILSTVVLQSYCHYKYSKAWICCFLKTRNLSTIVLQNLSLFKHSKRVN